MIARAVQNLKTDRNAERKRAQADYERAWTDHRNAVIRGDTRSMRTTREALSKAMTRRMQVGA